MRLIDADAFAEFLKDAVKRQKYEDIKIDGLLTVADVIEAIISELDGTSLDGFKNTPTIEPERKRGKWIHKGCGCFECDQCSKLVGSNVYTDAKVSNCFKFCPECGADMREEVV